MDALAVMMQDLLTQNHALRRENNELMDQVRRLLCEKANLLAQVRPPACPVVFPEAFNGDPARLPDFLIQAASYVNFFETRFSNDTLKVAFVISRLSGPAEEWVVPYIERESPILGQYERFVDALKRAFGRNG
ncbi:protein LDOC1-like [Marmota marmota marmota]|uniref:Protein LDOC1-like n=1 Tax=Marmota marmota marmota TaxID=9994 RepID=A0A8C6ETC8_MARMA|nr:protein LDOC1-like [Marmota marmota marmota]